VSPAENQLNPAHDPQTAAHGGAGSATPVSFSEVLADIVAQARQSASAGQFLRSALTCIARYFASPYGAIYVRYASEVFQEEHHVGPTDPRFWRESVQSFLTDSLGEPRPRAKLLRARTGKAKLAYLSAPIFDPTGPAIGAIALVVSPEEEVDLTSLIATLESMTRLTSFAVEFVGRGGVPDDVQSPGAAPAPSTAQTQSLRRAASCETVEELAFSLTNELCSKLSCEQVALGLVRRHNVRIVSISGLDNVSSHSPGAAAIRAAMEECLDADAIIVAGGGGDWSGDEVVGGYRLHRQWQAIARGDAVASMPLKAGDETTAVVSFRRRADQPFLTSQLAELRAKVEPYALALRLLRRASRGLPRHVSDSIGNAVRAVITPGHPGARVLAAALLLTLGFMAFGTMNYKVTVDCTVQPAESRHLAAPYDALIASASKIAGDKVAAGEVLCELDHRDLDQQKAELFAQVAVWETSKDQALATNDPVEYQLAVAQQQLVRVRLDIVRRRLEQAYIRAPFAGMVVRGDLRKRIGAVAARGETLFEIAPHTAWTLELHVPQSAAADLASGQAGLFAAFARPNQPVKFQVNRVLESAQVVDGRNVILAEADIQAREEWLRSGMEGVARVQIGSRRVWWVALHRAVDYLRLNFWL
jgi:multidrug efflux pump subunit AcrA (membrane-fusion protein)